MLTHHDTVKLLDFGLAKIAESEALGRDDIDSRAAELMTSSLDELTTQGRLLGTPSYMSPEQVTGRPLDLRSDLFSLGVILYEMLTGVRPFRGASVMDVLIAIARDEPEPAGKHNPAVPAEIERLLGRCLAKASEQRCEGAFEIYAAIERLLAAAKATSARCTPSISSTPHAAQEDQLQTLSSSGEVLLPGQFRAARRAFTSEERALIAVVLIEDAAPLIEMLRRDAESRGGRVSLLADSSLAATFGGHLIATDLAAHAARAGLALRRTATAQPMVLVMGRAEGTKAELPLELLERAKKKLAPTKAAAELDAQLRQTVALDELTAGLLGANFDVRNSDAGPQLVGELLIPEVARTLLGKPTPCVGRDRELATLASLFNQCVEAPLGRAVLVVAPPGTGKTRLAHEMIRVLSRQRGAELSIWMSWGECQGASSLSLLCHALRAESGIRGDEALAEQRDKLEKRVERSVPTGERRRIAEFLGELCHAPFPDDNSAPLRAARQDAELMNEQMRRAFVDFVAAETAQRPLLIVLDDLHWADSPTVRFIDAALRAHSDKPLMVLALARPEIHTRFPKLWATRDVHQIYLKELSRKASEQLVRQVLGRHADDALIDRLVDLSDGQAFYLEELIRAAVLRPTEALPATVIAMVQARLMDLGADERRLLRAASVFGEVFWQSAVEGLAGGRAAELLSTLVEREIIVRHFDSQFPGEREYAFRHALLREGAYAMLTDDDLVLGHRLAAEWLELRDEHKSLLIAEHFERGDRPLLAASFYSDAAIQALRAGDVEVAIACGERGLACGAMGSVRENLLWALCDAYAWRADYVRALPMAEEIMRHARPGSVAYLVAAKQQMGVALFSGKFDEVIAIVDAVQAVPPPPEAAGQVAAMLMSCAVILPLAGQIELGAAYLPKLRKLSADYSDKSPSAAGWMHFGFALDHLCTREDPGSALLEAEACHSRFAGAGDGKGCALAQILIGMSAWYLGDAARTERELLEPGALDPDLPAMAAHRAAIYVDLLLARGELAEALRCATSFAERGQAKQNSFNEGFGRHALAKVLHAADELAAAEREAVRARELLVMPVYALWPLTVLSAIRRTQGRLKEACELAAQAVHGSETLRNFGYRGAEIRLQYAEALEMAGEREAARRGIASARDRLLATAAQIGDLKRRRSFLHEVPSNARTLDLAHAWLGSSDSAWGDAL